jgi:antitoxin (DNA-binding transcriptional repressor) of toxin-antitoxin stability system
LRAQRHNVPIRRASIRDLRIRTSELVRDAEKGEVIVIERRGEPGRGASSITKAAQADEAPRHEPLLDRVPQVRADSTDLISEDRGR